MVELDYELAVSLYVEQGLNINQISKHINRSHAYVKSRIKQYDLVKTKIYQDPEWLYQKYITENLSTVQIAELVGVTDPTIATALRTHNIVKDKKDLQKAKQARAQQTFQERYGSKSFFGTDVAKAKITKTILSRYGVENLRSIDGVNAKIENTCIERYGARSPFGNTEIQEKIKNTRIKKGLTKPLCNGQTINQICLEKEISPSMFYLKRDLFEDQELLEYIENYKQYSTLLEQRFSNLTGLTKYDRYWDLEQFPDLRYKPDFKVNDYLAINVDGLYWHSEKYLDKKYHFQLRKEFENKGLRIMQFRADEVYFKPEIVQSMVLNQQGYCKKIGARTTEIVPVSQSEARTFLDQNHLMGNFLAKHLALIKNGTILSLISYKTYSDKIKIERFCSLLNYVVVGGASKLLQHIPNPNHLPIHYWADLRYGTGSYLSNLGFQHERDTLGWKWTDTINTFNRLACRANMDNQKLSQKQYAETKGWFKIYDAGQRLWVKW